MNELTTFINRCIEDNNIMAFYNTRAWRKLSAEVKREAHGECQRCKERGKLRRAECVHHIFEVRQFPQYALTKTIETAYGPKQNLIALCNECHEREHGRFIFDANKIKDRFTNVERW